MYFITRGGERNNEYHARHGDREDERDWDQEGTGSEAKGCTPPVLDRGPRPLRGGWRDRARTWCCRSICTAVFPGLEHCGRTSGCRPGDGLLGLRRCLLRALAGATCIEARADHGTQICVTGRLGARGLRLPAEAHHPCEQGWRGGPPTEDLSVELTE